LLQSADALAHLYNSPDDVDMLVGGGLEHNVPGALAGPTMLCIMGEQFRRTKRGDRFWFELSGQPSSFTHGKKSKKFKKTGYNF
jgi:peroxidase